MASEGYIPFHPEPKKPEIALPKGACDSHCHVFGPGDRFPYSPKSSYIPVDAPKETLFQRHRHLGLDRAVIVQASCHGTDNEAMLDALASAGDAYRGIAIVDGEITDSELLSMHERGVRGVRFNFLRRLKARQSVDERRAVIKKVRRLNWHIVVYFEPDDLPDIKDFLLESPVPVIIDHMGCITPAMGVEGPEFAQLAELIRDPRFFIKVSCPERFSLAGPPYEDTDAIAKELIRLVPDRVLWGTDWPHPNMKTHAPDDGLLVDRLSRICRDENDLNRLVIRNPDMLYWGA